MNYRSTLTSLAKMASEITTFPAPASNLSILVLGAGGREHALSFKLAQSPRVNNVFVAPGNGGTALMGGKVQNVSIPWGGSKGYGAVVQWAKGNNVDLVVPGPEQPLVEGVEQELRKGKLDHSTL
jgi:phosphoribosylamine--glycine ligase/phosphoribosylformylglycinamidine cyclo-ligase